MNVLVYPHSMEVGGSQLNAVQLAGAVRDRGHQVAVLSEAGPLVKKVKALDLEHIEIPMRRRRPSPTVARMIYGLARTRGVEVVHGYEWPPIIDAFLGVGACRRIPVVGTVMSMSVAPFLPRSVPLTVGTEFIRQAAEAAGFRNVSLLEPPVDTDADRPGVDGQAFRARIGLHPDELMISIICRLVPDLKLEGILCACDAVRGLVLSGRLARLVIVGDGPARGAVAERAALINSELGRQVIITIGEMTDPAPAYAAADIMVGQGGSALRGMAFAKPLVVVGEEGFSELLTPQSMGLFLNQGWYGLGSGSRGAGVSALQSALEYLTDSSDARRELGTFGRELAENRFSLNRAAEMLERIYLSATECPDSRGRWAAEMVRSNVGLFQSKLHQKYQRWRGVAAADDCNARNLISSVIVNGRQSSPSQ